MLGLWSRTRPRGHPSSLLAAASDFSLEQRCSLAIERMKTGAKRIFSSTNFRSYSQHQGSSVDNEPDQIFPRRYFFPRNVSAMRQHESQLMFLRDSCTCPLCVGVTTRQRNFQTYQIPRNIRIRHLTKEGPLFKIWWENDVPGFHPNHVTSISYRDLWKLQGPRSLQNILRRRKTWHNPDFEPHEVNFRQYMKEKQTFSLAMRHLYTDGILFINDVPEKDTSVEEIAEKIGPLRNTFYGKTWDVISQPNARNIAYTSGKLDFHMDLLYMSKPPSYQLLHCMDNSCPGGASRFVDTFAAAYVLKRMHPMLYEKLAGTSLTFHYQNQGHHYMRQVPTFEVNYSKVLGQFPVRLSELAPSTDQSAPSESDPSFPTPPIDPRQAAAEAARSYLQGHYISELKAINFSPPFQGPLPASTGKLSFLLLALKRFREILEIPEIGYKSKLHPGTCVIFENRRIAHARNAFYVNPGTKRKLRGAYLDDDDFLSRCQELWEGDRGIWEGAVDFDDPSEDFMKWPDDGVAGQPLEEGDVTGDETLSAWPAVSSPPVTYYEENWSEEDIPDTWD